MPVPTSPLPARDVLSEEEYLDRAGEVRSVTITELGFSSGSGERLQAADIQHKIRVFSRPVRVNIAEHILYILPRMVILIHIWKW